MNVKILFEQAFSHFKAGRLDEAERLFRSIAESKPGIGNDAKPYADAVHFLGVTLATSHRYTEALPLLDKSIALRPRDAQYRRNLAAMLVMHGRPEDMERGYQAAREALPAFPDDPALQEFIARSAGATGRLLEAGAAWRRVADFVPQNAGVRFNAGLMLHNGGDTEGAIEAYEGVLRIDPTHADALTNLTNLYGAIRNPTRAFVLLEHLNALGKLGEASKPIYAYLLITYGEIARGEALLASTNVDLSPPRGTAAHDATSAALPYIAAAYLGAGELAQSLKLSEAYCTLNPTEVHGHASHVSSAQYKYPDDPITHRALHERFNREIASTISVMPTMPMTPLAGRRLRVGYVSGDFREHSVAAFFEPLLDHHDRARVDVHLFHNSHFADAITARLRARAEHWHDVVQMSDDALAQLIRRQQIDVLVDLSGYTGGARLTMIAKRPAPVQLTYLGYSSTTGIEAMDGYITDAVCDPPENDSHFTERLLRLPHTLGVFRAPVDAPAVAPPPAIDRGYITFGSVAVLRKINDAVLDAWSIALRALPTAKLLIIGTGFGDAHFQARFHEKFAARGIDSGRITFVGKTPFRQYLELHSQIDLMLDTFPFSGHTTTVQNLWMGVPVATYAGVSHRSRMSASVLKSIGLDELICDREDDYGPFIARWASNVPKLAELRASMRERMLASPLMDEAGFARDFENLLINAYESKRTTGHV